MSSVFPRVLVIGLGKMGQTVKALLMEEYEVTGVDTVAEAKAQQLWRSPPDMVFACLPYHATLEAANYAASLGTDYTDLTEDIQVREAIRELAKKHPDQLFISGSGLAPGYINMIAGRLARHVESPEIVEMMCGALPMDPKCNKLGYQVSWSSNGLVRECSAPCEVKQKGRVKWAVPLLETKRHVLGSWPLLESFYTSGGAGTTVHTLSAPNVEYRTLRYPGHMDHFKKLLSESNPERAISEACGELTGPDIVYVSVRVIGPGADVHHLETMIGQRGFTAIQYATASGAIKVWEAAVEQKQKGFVRPEQL